MVLYKTNQTRPSDRLPRLIARVAAELRTASMAGNMGMVGNGAAMHNMAMMPPQPPGPPGPPPVGAGGSDSDVAVAGAGTAAPVRIMQRKRTANGPSPSPAGPGDAASAAGTAVSLEDAAARCGRGGAGSPSGGGKRHPFIITIPSSLLKREEEYHRARERIFGEGEDNNSEGAAADGDQPASGADGEGNGSDQKVGSSARMESNERARCHPPLSLSL